MKLPGAISAACVMVVCGDPRSFADVGCSTLSTGAIRVIIFAVLHARGTWRLWNSRNYIFQVTQLSYKIPKKLCVPDALRNRQ